MLGLALVVALPSALIAWSRGFDGLYGQDAYAYWDYSISSVRHSLEARAPLEPFFWPPGYPLLVALVSFVTGPLAGQLVSLAAGAAVPALTALLVRELRPHQPGLALIAGLLAAIAGQLWQSSVVVMADTTGLAFATFSALALARYVRTQHLAWLIAASAAIAYATLARWIYGLVAIPLALYALSALPRQPARAIAHAVFGVAVGAAITIPFLGAPTIAALLHPDQPASFAGNLQVYSWSPLNAFKSDFETADGHLVYAIPNGLYYAIAPGNWALFGPLLAPWILFGVCRAARTWTRPDTLLIVGWAAIVLAFHAGAPWQNFRFALAFLPPLAILAATGLIGALNTKARPLAIVCAVSALLVMANGVRLLEGFVDRKDDELALMSLVRDETVPLAQLFTFGPTLAFRHYTGYQVLDLYEDSPADLQTHLSRPVPSFALLDEASIASQWAAAAPGRNLTALRESRTLVPIGTYGPYTLYRLDAR
jgi:hypothetical protein